ncbi:hypothetical protein TSAR_004459 [Trichomalopsis sarcophagae]|uniref:BTB domain-containing protein n=1 Tax=Trichomalopsis sarcophagae TaxID=543379 RepID=A0A232FA28_9HYME|nr:hypothetical protein TSAR_004459 [Trichomalopsis sarcophagae]
MNTDSIGSVTNVSSKFVWEIDYFSISNFKKIGDCEISPNFSASSVTNKDTNFNMELYPRGVNEDCKGYLSLRVLTSDCIITKIDIKILNNKGEVAKNSVIEDAHITYSRGDDKFISKDFILNPVNNILNKGKLTIVCEIIRLSYVATEIKLKEKEQEAAALSRLAVLDAYENLIDDNQLSDVSLIAEGKAVKAHKCVLANSSKVFAAMFNAEMREKHENIVKITDIKYEVLVELIRFIYAGKVNNIDTLAEELLTAADKYGLNGTFEDTIAKNLSVDNVLHYLQLAQKLHINKLTEQALDFIVENASDVTEKPEFALLTDPDILRKVCCALAKKHAY